MNLALARDCYDVAPDPNGMKQYRVCGKSFQESATIEYVIPILEKFYNDYGRRAKLAAENKNIDWKAVSHALRAAYRTREILTKNSITFPLRSADFLIIVKQGQLDYLSEVGPKLETPMEEVERLALDSKLPETVDRKFWDQFICDTLESELFRIRAISSSKSFNPCSSTNCRPLLTDLLTVWI